VQGVSLGELSWLEARPARRGGGAAGGAGGGGGRGECGRCGRGLQVLDLLHFLVDDGLRVGLFPPGWIGCEVSFWDGLEAWCCG